MVSSPLDLTVRDRRLFVPNTSNKKPMKHTMMANITNITSGRISPFLAMLGIRARSRANVKNGMYKELLANETDINFLI